MNGNNKALSLNYASLSLMEHFYMNPTKISLRHEMPDEATFTFFTHYKMVKL